MSKVIITTSWDDGHVLDFKVAELLRKYNLKGTFYVAPEDRELKVEDRLNAGQIKELSAGFEIGAHTMTHPRLTQVSVETAKSEIENSKNYLEKILEKSVKSFCYPGGEFNKGHENLVKEAGFKFGRNVKRFETQTGKNPFSVPTAIHAYRHWSDAFSILLFGGVSNFLNYYFNWDKLAIAMFDKVQAEGGVFHLWGHSWEIDKNSDWARLENVFKHISNRNEVSYLENGDLEINTEKTILFVTPYFPPQGGGLERYAYEISRNLQKNHDYKVIVLTSGERYGQDSKEEKDSLTIYRLSYNLKISNTPFGFLWFRKIPKILKEIKPDIINIHTPVPGIGDITSMFAGKTPTVVTYHTGSMHKSKTLPDIFVWLYERGPMRWMLNHAKQIICSSDFVRFQFLGKYLYKSTTITPAVDTSIFSPDLNKKSNKPTILFVAGLNYSEQYKGLKTLLDAVKILKSQIPDIHLNVVGDGDMRHEYENYAVDLGISSSVNFRGRLFGEPLANAYQEASIFVLPTSNDSFPITILEAMASGLPVISTKAGGIPTIIENGKEGFLINEINAEELSQNILRVINNDEMAKELGNCGRSKTLEKFNWADQANEYEIVLSESLNRQKKLQKKVAIVAPYFYPKVGGLENYALEMARAMKKADYDVFVITSNHTSRNWKYDEVEGMRVYRMPRLFKISNTPINPFWYYSIWRIFKQERPNIINAHTPVPFISDMADRVRGEVPLVLNYHNDLVKQDFLPNILCKITYWLMINKTLRRADKIITTSQYYALQSSYLSKFINKISFVPPGVDTNKFRTNLETPYFDQKFNGFKTILFVGQLDKTHKHKGVEDLILATSKIKNSIPNIKLVVVGKGNNIFGYTKYAKSLGIAENVNFEGFVDDSLLPQYYAGADVLALPSQDRAEGFGMVITEAAACGTPAVATNVGGIPAALIDGETGILVPAQNIDKLAKSLETILQNSELAATLGKQASERIQKEFTLPIVANKFLEVIGKSKKQLSIVQVVPYYPPHMGGMELRVRDLSTFLAEKGVHVKLFTSSVGSKTGNKNQGGVDVSYLRAFDFANTPITPSLIWRLFRVNKPDVFHIHISQAFFPEVAAFVAKIRNIPYIAHIRLLVNASGIFGILLPIYRFLILKPVLLGAKKIITLTEDDKLIINKRFHVPLENIEVIPNATIFSINNEPRVPHKQMRLLAVGRISAQKNYKFMLEIMDILKRNYSLDFQLQIVGSGDGIVELEENIRKYNLENNVKLLGEKKGKELEDIYADSDLLIHTSTVEAFGTIFIEAMAKGLPIVASDIPGTRSVVKNNRNGLLNDFSVDNMAKSIMIFYENQDLYRNTSKNNLDDVKKYNWINIVEETIGIYNQVKNFE